MCIRDRFCNQDIDDIYQDSLLEVEKHYINGLNKHEEELKEPPKNMDLDEVIKQEWVNVSLWEKKVSSTKASKRANMIPRISDSEYIEIKYVIGVLFKLFSNEKNQTTLSINQYLHELPRCERDPVSYTHLDVYKRQAPTLPWPSVCWSSLSRTSLSSWARLSSIRTSSPVTLCCRYLLSCTLATKSTTEPRSSRLLISTWSPTGMSLTPKSNSTRPVSYTHLDVYKRQCGHWIYDF